MSWTWDDFPESPVRAGGEVRLEANGWQALIAFLAGPEWVYQVPSAESEVVRVHDREGRVWSERRTGRDRRIVREELTEYLQTAGIPAPPESVEWRLVLPPGLTEPDFWNNVAAVAAGSPPFGPATAHRLVQRLQAAVRDLLPAS